MVASGMLVRGWEHACDCQQAASAETWNCVGHAGMGGGGKNPKLAQKVPEECGIIDIRAGGTNLLGMQLSVPSVILG